MTDAITTTLANIRKHSLWTGGYKLLCESLGGVKVYGKDTPITFRQIYESNGYSDTLWCLRTVGMEHGNLVRHFAIDCAEQVKHWMTDQRSIDALTVARRYADGLATDEELKTAKEAAWAAAKATAWAAAGATAWAAAGATARAAAEAASWAAWAAADTDAWTAAEAAADTAAWAAVRTAAEGAQMQLLFEYCRTGKRVMQKETVQ